MRVFPTLNRHIDDVRISYNEEVGLEMAKVLVLGGAGEMGSVAVRDLVAHSDHEITIGDLMVDRAEKLLDSLGAPTLVRQIDVSDDAHRLAEVFAEYDLVLAATLMRFNLTITDAVIEAGVHMVDLGSYFVDTEAQLGRHERAAASGSRIVPGCGVAPGLTNILAALGASKLDRVDSVRLYSHITHPMYTSPGIVVTRFDASTGTSLILRDGERVERPSFDDQETVVFAEPYGEQHVHNVPHPEVITLPRYFDVKNVVFKVGYTAEEENRIRTMLELGFDSDEPFEVGGQRISPRAFASAFIGRRGLAANEHNVNTKRVLVTGHRGGEQLTYAYDFAVESEGNSSASSAITGTVAAIAAAIVVDGGIPGVIAPEAGLDPEGFLAELAKRGLAVDETVFPGEYTAVAAD